MPSDYLWLIPLVPFAGFLINGTIGRRFPRALVSAVALLCTAIPAILVAWLWITMKAPGAPEVLPIVSRPWIQITGLTVNFAFTVDHLTLIMLGVVTGVGFLIHVYSVGYMAHEEGYWRFFAYLNLFMFFMLVLVLAESFLLMFVGWEGVGLASYLLIGFYFQKDSAANAGKKAFIFNRVGDFGFLLAMFLIVREFGSLDFSHVFNAISVNPEWHGGVLTAIALLLVLGATGKSAQIPLYVWLPDAMEGPTPVSALIHAATMVTAGIYMVARCHTLFDRSPYALAVVAIIGAATAIFAASIGMVQHDIKRVLAYSTVSQLGYMFLACGVGAYGRNLPSRDACLLQGASLPRCRLGHPCALWRAGHAQDGRPAQTHPRHLLDHDDGRLRYCRHPGLGRILLEGRDTLPGLRLKQPHWQACLAHRPHHRGHDFVLYVPALVQDLLGP